MKVLLVGNYAPDRQESMQRFAQVLERELKARGHRVRLLRPTPRLNRAGRAPSGAAKWLGYADKYVLFPPLLRRAARRADVVHVCDHSNAVYVRSLGRAPHVVTCNDVLAIRSALGLVPENPTGWSGRLLQRWIESGLRRARRVECISRNTRRELLEVCARAPGATGVVYMGQNYSWSPMPGAEARELVRARLGERAEEVLGRGFVLHVGGNQWYKNRAGVLRIYNFLRREAGPSAPMLVLVGKPFTDEMRQIVAELHLGADVLEVKGASNEELRALYSLARALVFPSLAEGFGWPIAEALACGCRVLTSDRAPMTEVGGDAAAYADPDDEAAVAERLRELLGEGEEEKRARVEAGLSQAARFSTQSMIDAYERVYAELASRPAASGAA